MRALHTADWHIGQTLNGWSREAEHVIFLEALGDLIEAERIDLLIIAGDVFDNTNPSGESQNLFYRSMANFKRRRPGLKVIISGGNHDPALRLEAPGPLYEGFDIHAVGTMGRLDGEIDMDKHLIPVHNEAGDVELYVLAIPFLRAADLTGLTFSQDDRNNSVIEAAQRFHEEIVEAAEVHIGDVPLIMTGHLHCAGGQESEGAERSILIGGSHAVPPDIFPERAEYVALGHLHGHQSLDGGRVRYSGSCFPLSAAEIRYQHGVTVLDISRGEIKHAHHALPRPAPVLRLPEKGLMTLAQMEEVLAGIEVIDDINLRPLVYIELEAEDAPAVMMGKAETLLREAPVRTAGIRIHRAQDTVKERREAPTKSLNETTPETLFLTAFAAKNGFEPEDRHLAAFRDILAGD